MKKNSWLQSPKFRYGSLSVLIAVLFLTVIVLFNVILQYLEEEYGWWRDMSFNGYATTSKETEEKLSYLNKDVELYLLYQGDDIDENLHQVLKAYALLNGHLHIQLTDIAQNPGILTRFQGNENTGVTADTIIVNCPDTERYKVLGYNDFMTAEYLPETGDWQLSGLAYEKCLTEAIVNVSQENLPVIGFLQGHGELDSEMLSTFTSLLESNGYQALSVSLLQQNNLEGIDMLAIFSPIIDFSENELKILSDFARNGGQFLVTRDYTDPIRTMPNYTSFLNAYNVIPLEGVVVASEKDTGSYYDNRIYLLPYMESLDITLPLIMGDMSILLMPASSAFESPAEGNSSLSAATVLKTAPNAYLRRLDDGIDSIEKQAGDRQGELTLAIYAQNMHSNGNISRMFACGSSLMLTEEYIYQRTYCQEFILTILNAMVPASSTSLDIQPSLAVRPGLKAGCESKALTVMITIPALIMCVGIFVITKRRSR